MIFGCIQNLRESLSLLNLLKEFISLYISLVGHYLFTSNSDLEEAKFEIGSWMTIFPSIKQRLLVSLEIFLLSDILVS